MPLTQSPAQRRRKKIGGGEKQEGVGLSKGIYFTRFPMLFAPHSVGFCFLTCGKCEVKCLYVHAQWAGKVSWELLKIIKDKNWLLLKLKNSQFLTAEQLIWRRKQCYKTEGDHLLFAFSEKHQLVWVPKCLISYAKPACIGAWVQTLSERNFCPPEGRAFQKDVASFAIPCGRAWTFSSSSRKGQ